ncbi:hypothetical protein M3Y99_01401500 [Aphelenchoides fujianensis]|nr:hypothetical protein M3Y99_01401500 [Aphelenchoides fujianensis]
MPTFTLHFKAHLENLSSLQPEDFSSHQWSIKLKCTGCREVSDKWRFISAEELVDIPNSRGQANYVEKCSFCGKQNTINILPDFHAYTKSDEFQPMVKFECRGTEPVEFQPTGEWRAESESGSQFTKIDISETFADYDEKGERVRDDRRGGGEIRLIPSFVVPVQ